MLFSYAWKELTRRKTRTALAVLGIFLSITLLVAVLAITDSVNKTVGLTFSAAGADMVVQTFVEPGPWEKIRLARHLGPIPADVVSQIKAFPEVEHAAGQLHFWAYKPGEKPIHAAMSAIAGINPANPYIGPLTVQHSIMEEVGKVCCSITDGRPLEAGDKYSAFLDKRYADKLKLKVGSKLRISDYDFEIVGLGDLQGVTRVAQAEVFIPISVAQRIVAEGQKNVGAIMEEKGDIVNLILVKVKSTKDMNVVENKIRGLVVKAADVSPKEVKIFTESNILPGVAGMSMFAQKMIKTVSIVVLLAVMLMIIRAGFASVSERTNEIGILKTVGWRDAEVSKLITIESALQGLIGGISGCAVGYFIAFVYAANAKLILPQGMNPFACKPVIPAPVELAVPFHISGLSILVALAIAVGMGIISGYLASRKAAAMAPAQALRRI